MNKINLGAFKISSKEPSVPVADVQRIRRQRRLAKSEEEYRAVRSHMRDLAGDLKSRTIPNAKLLKITGIVIIVLGLIIGGVLAYAAFLV